MDLMRRWVASTRGGFGSPLVPCLALACLLALAPPASTTGADAAALTPTERAIARRVDAYQPAALLLLERVVNINSGTQNFEGVRAVGKVFRRSSTRSASSHAVGGRRPVQAGGAPGGPSSRPRAEAPADRPPRYGVRAEQPVPEVRAGRRQRRARPRHHRHEGRRRRHAVQALKALTSIGACSIDEHRRGDDRRRREAAASRSRSRAALTRGRAGRRGGDRLRGRAGDPRNGGHLAPRDVDVDATGHGHAGALVADLPADIGAGAIFEAARDPQRRSASSSRRQPHLTFNPGIDRRRHERRARSGPDAAAPRSARPTSSPSTPSFTATCGRCRPSSSRRRSEGDVRAIVADIAAAHRRRSITFEDGYPPLAPTDGNRRCSRCTTRRAATSVRARHGGRSRSRRAPRTCRSSRRKCRCRSTASA